MNWNLDNYYTGFNEQFFADVKLVEDTAENFDALLSYIEVSEDSINVKFRTYINAYTSLEGVAGKLLNYCSLLLAVNSNDSVAQKNSQVVKSHLNNIVEAKTAIESYFQNVENLVEIVLNDEDIAKYAFIALELSEEKQYTLDPQTESVIAKLKSTGSSSWATFKAQVISNHTVTIDDTTYPLTQALNFAYSPDRELRKKAYEAEIASYKSIEYAVATSLNAIKGEAITDASVRGYDSVLDMTIKSSRINEKILDSLLTAIKNNLAMFEKYYLAKAKYLGTEKLAWYDMYAEVTNSTVEVSYEEAKQIVINSFNAYSTEMGDFAKKAFDNDWIDVYPKVGKVSGAFCSSNSTVNESRILLNYGNSVSDVITLAHELGHGYHSYCLKNTHPLLRSYPMTLAETASNFCEIITKKYLFETGDNTTKLAILESEISDTAQVIVDIYSRYLFESNFIEQRENGNLTVEEIKDLMLDAQKKAYGNGLDHNYLHPYMWTWKPHYYSVNANFYNFPYAFGALFSKGLYANYLENKDGFLNDYNNLLEATGRMKVADVTQLANINVETVEFWDNALKQVESDINEFVTLLDKAR